MRVHIAEKGEKSEAGVCGFFMRVCVGRFQREKNFGFIFMGSGIGGSCLDGRILYDFIRLG